MKKNIFVKGARTHNLKNINVEIPRNKMVTITGLSGSGKSSLAFDTIYAEGQRRYMESLSIEQKSSSHNPRSTVGTVTEIYDYLRLLYARVGTARCPEHDIELDAMPIGDMSEKIIKEYNGIQIAVLAPIVKKQKGEHIKLLQTYQQQGHQSG